MRLSAEKNDAYLPAADDTTLNATPHTHHQHFPSPALVVGGLLPQAVTPRGVASMWCVE